MACAAASVAGAILCDARPARADMDFQVAGTAGASWIRSMPELESESITNAARIVPAAKIPIGGSVTALGGSFDMAVSLDDRWTLPVLGFSAYGAVGSYATVITSADGSIARVRPWTTYEIDVLLPGVGYRVTRRRYMFSAVLRTGFTSLNANASIAGGAESTPITVTGLSALLQAELEGCRRLDPVTRVCLHVAPRIYNFGFMNGATVGLRVEWGR